MKIRRIILHLSALYFLRLDCGKNKRCVGRYGYGACMYGINAIETDLDTLMMSSLGFLIRYSQFLSSQSQEEQIHDNKYIPPISDLNPLILTLLKMSLLLF